jgi:hypothetical protein
VPSTCAARRFQSVAVAGVTGVPGEDAVPVGWTGGAGVSVGGEAVWEAQASMTPATPTRAPARTGRRPSNLSTVAG